MLILFEKSFSLLMCSNMVFLGLCVLKPENEYTQKLYVANTCVVSGIALGILVNSFIQEARELLPEINFEFTDVKMSNKEDNRQK